MDARARQETSATAYNQFPSPDSRFTSQGLLYNTGNPTDSYWCEACGLPWNECLCYGASPINDDTTFDAEASAYYSYDPSLYPATYKTSSSSGSSYYNPPSESSPNCITAPAVKDEDSDTKSIAQEPKSKRSRKKNSMTPAEVRQKRLEQNRRSQRSFRDRQARLVTDLKQKVDILTEQNQRLLSKLSSRGAGDFSRESSSPGMDLSHY